MISGNGRASNRLVVGRGTDAGSGGSTPHSRFWRGVSRRVQLVRRTGPGGGAAGNPGRASGAAPASADHDGHARLQPFWGEFGGEQLRVECSKFYDWFGSIWVFHIHGSARSSIRRWP